MDDTTLSVLSGVAQGIEKATQNLFNISIMKQELKQKQEAFGLDKKVKEAQLKKLEFEQGPEAMQGLQELQRAEVNKFNADTAFALEKLNAEELKNKELAIQYGDFEKQYKAYREGQKSTQLSDTAQAMAAISGVPEAQPMGRADFMQENYPGLSESITGKSIPKQTIKESLNDTLSRISTGEATWEEAKRKFPIEIETIEKAKAKLTPVGKAEGFKAGTGGMISNLLSFFNPRMAELNPPTKKVISNIKTEDDLKDFFDNIDKYTNAGVDTAAILEYFGKEKL